MKIVLIGFMGAGKSAVAKKLAKHIGLQAVEMDVLALEKSKENSINDIFAKKGETAFRELEMSVAKQLRESDNIVIATGGGVIMNKINIDYLKEKNGTVVYLDTTFETVKRRLKKDTTRPLMRDLEKAEKLYIWRKSLYESYADMLINTENKSVDTVCNEILTRLEEK